MQTKKNRASLAAVAVLVLIVLGLKWHVNTTEQVRIANYHKQNCEVIWSSTMPKHWECPIEQYDPSWARP